MIQELDQSMLDLGVIEESFSDGKAQQCWSLSLMGPFGFA